jgi:hypothetical protein
MATMRPTAPPKATDNRAFEGETCQCDAILPDALADIVRTAITERIDMRAYNEVLRAEKAARRTFAAKLKDL